MWGNTGRCSGAKSRKEAEGGSRGAGPFYRKGAGAQRNAKFLSWREVIYKWLLVNDCIHRSISVALLTDVMVNGD